MKGFLEQGEVEILDGVGWRVEGRYVLGPTGATRVQVWEDGTWNIWGERSGRILVRSALEKAAAAAGRGDIAALLRQIQVPAHGSPAARRIVEDDEARSRRHDGDPLLEAVRRELRDTAKNVPLVLQVEGGTLAYDIIELAVMSGWQSLWRKVRTVMGTDADHYTQQVEMIAGLCEGRFVEFEWV